MLNGLDPNRSSPEERLQEIADTLATGLWRLGHRRRQAINSSNFSHLTDNSLDIRRRQSVDSGVSGDLENPHAR